MNEFVVTVNGIKKKVRIEGSTAIIEGKEYNFELQKLNSGFFLLKAGDCFFEIYSIKVSEDKYSVTLNGRNFDILIRSELQEKAAKLIELKTESNHHSEIRSPMPGLILKVKKKIGEEVFLGEPVLILEAMKMENELRSPSKGRIREIFVKEGKAVEKGAVLFIVDQS
jgi:pyruvate carboxylase subunit B